MATVSSHRLLLLSCSTVTRRARPRTVCGAHVFLSTENLFSASCLILHHLTVFLLSPATLNRVSRPPLSHKLMFSAGYFLTYWPPSHRARVFFSSFSSENIAHVGHKGDRGAEWGGDAVKQIGFNRNLSSCHPVASPPGPPRGSSRRSVNLQREAPPDLPAVCGI